MRQRTDSRSGKTPSTVLEKNFREIVVGSGRSQEPYVIAFHYASDNISGSPLGTLFGFFEVEIHDQDAAYIVNFLASVAKKEYFANPRRSPIESFEGALHKINVALAEIVKHGNISWLGHLHGAIGAVSENCLNFSVTGEGELYLAREESLRSISEGLAETGSEPHPLKTFTEVSSGDLFDGDLVFALSPSVWSLFSPEDLRRSLNRLGPAGFEQFLRTALVNELPVAAVTLLTCSAPVELKKEEVKESSRKPVISLGNVWSDAPFTEALQTKTESSSAQVPIDSAEAKTEDYTDKKTGHIYVQASADEAFEENNNPWKERWEIYSHELGGKLRSLQVSTKKVTRRVTKESALALGALTDQLAASNRSVSRRARTLKRTIENRWQIHRQKQLEKKQQALLKTVAEEVESAPKPEFTEEMAYPTTPPVPPPQRESSKLSNQSSDRVRRFFSREPRQETAFSDWLKEQIAQFREHIPTVKPSFLPVVENLGGSAKNILLQANQYLTGLATRGQSLWNACSPKQRWIAVGFALFILGILSYLALPSEEPQPVETVAAPSTQTPEMPTFPPAGESKAILLSENQSVFNLPDEASAIALTSVNNQPFLITSKSIVNLETRESTPTPEPIRLAAAMDDLDSIFVLGTSDTLYNYSIATKQFTKNSLPVPPSTKISDIGAYLTYLYVLDRDRGTLQRFPRAEGGFGAPAPWLKETVALAADGEMAVFENIALTLKNKEPALYSRGNRIGVTFAGTTTLVTTDTIAFDQKTGDLLVLDRANKRIVRWSVAGTLLAQYFHESFAHAEIIAVSPTGELLVSSQTSVTTWQIQ